MSSATAKPKIQPFLRWAGSKRQLIPVLSGYWSSDYSRYIEPFAGSASLFFAIRPNRAVLADINEELIFMYKQVRDNLPHVNRSLRTLDTGKEAYLQVRSLKHGELASEARASRFIYLNRYCFNGLYRTNLNGEFNVPYGGWKSGSLPSDAHLEMCSNALQVAKLISGTFEQTLELTRPGDFVYMDPPYSVRSRRVFNEYDASIFTLDQVRILRTWLEKLDEQGIGFLVSYAESEEGEILSTGFSVESVTVRRNIAGFAAKRKSATEVLITNRVPAS